VDVLVFSVIDYLHRLSAFSKAYRLVYTVYTTIVCSLVRYSWF